MKAVLKSVVGRREEEEEAMWMEEVCMGDIVTWGTLRFQRGASDVFNADHVRGGNFRSSD